MDPPKVENGDKEQIQLDVNEKTSKTPENMKYKPRGCVHGMTDHEKPGSRYSQVPFSQVLEVIVQSLHEKEIENRNLKEKCSQLEDKLNMQLLMQTSKLKLLDLKRKSLHAKTLAEVSTNALTGSKSSGHFTQKYIESRTKSPISQKSMELPRKEQKTLQRTQSEPLKHKELLEQHRKFSHPEVFLFPERQQPSSLHSKSFHAISGNLNSNDVTVSLDGDKHDLVVHWDESEEFEGLEENFQEPSGVSAVNFHNVINELMKAKTCLYDLQMRLKTQKEGTNEMEMEKMRTEIQQLRFKNLQLEKQLAKQENESTQSSADEGLSKENSFELEDSDASVTAEKQHLNEVEILDLKTKNEELKGQLRVLHAEKEALQFQLETDLKSTRQELKALNAEYDKQKQNMKILSTCLSEEKLRFKTVDERLRNKTEESKKLILQLGSLRQKYEELQQEKNALEKARKIESLSAQLNLSSGIHSAGAYPHRSAKINTTSYPPLGGKVPTAHVYNIRPGSEKPNNLSQTEMKPSNVTPFHCPRCLQGFQVENSYQLHLEKCIE